MKVEPAQLSDGDLVRATARGDQTALAQLYDRYRLILFGLILRILNDRAAAEDVLQETFLQVWRRANDFDENRGRAFTWLVTIARSRALDRLRSHGSRERIAAEAAAEPRDVMGDASAETLRSEEAVVVRRALIELPEEQQRALLLAYFEGLTQTEIATRLGIPLGTVKTRVRSGMIRLRELLRDQFPGRR